ncbi:hypothetical protein CPCDC_5g3605 [Cryptosporidium sp. 43IA8]|nr:hypothetical protein CPCDC_5g3605 [Cryptosporidium sp. 43IA8]
MLIDFSIVFILIFAIYILNDLSIGGLLSLHKDLDSNATFHSQNWALIKLKASNNDQDSIVSSSELDNGATGGPKSDEDKSQSCTDDSFDSTFLFSGYIVNFDKSQPSGPCKIFPDFSKHQTEPCSANPSRLHPIHINSCGEKAISCYECESNVFPQTLNEWVEKFEHEPCKNSRKQFHFTRLCSNGQKLIFCSDCQKENGKSASNELHRLSNDFSNSVFFLTDDFSGVEDCPSNPGNSHTYYLDFRGIKHIPCYECENFLTDISIHDYNEKKRIEPCHRSAKGFHLVESGRNNNKFIYCTSCSDFYNHKKTTSKPKLIHFKDKNIFKLESCPSKSGLTHQSQRDCLIMCLLKGENMSVAQIDLEENMSLKAEEMDLN